MKKTIAILIISVAAFAAPLISPIDAMQSVFGETSVITKKNSLLTKAQATQVTKMAKLKLTTKIYRIYTATVNDETVGYGILITRKVRQKDASVLYMLTPGGSIAAVEIIAFNEPPEYMPQTAYLIQFKDKDANDTLRVGKDVPAVSGATLSARNVTDGARLALAVFETVIRGR